MSSAFPERIALVLGGGGLKGFAHIGVLRALEERGIRPTRIAGTSIGALIGAAWAGGRSVDALEAAARAVTKKDLFRIDHVNMVMKRMLSPSLYLAQPLQAVVDSLVPKVRFDELPIEVLVNTVDLERGAQLVFGLPGLRDVPVNEAVYASCALPGFFPPRVIRGRPCVDGGVMDNVPATIAAAGMDAIIAVDVGSSNMATARRIQNKGFAAIYMRAAQTMMKSLQGAQLQSWSGPPMLLVRPAVWRYHWFSFAHVDAMIDAGYAAAVDALDRVGDSLMSAGGIYPRRMVDVRIDASKCTGCRLCTLLAPDVVEMGDDGKARVIESPVEWSRADGDFVHQCPTDAISAAVAEGGVMRTTMELPVAPEEDEVDAEP
ncbi:MAG: patatin-like phospholipase family protein [Gemmatimonadaceae bacterium]|nr:patatin-like phospholipase family protein [Gemmatimonadaceae bacterium]